MIVYQFLIPYIPPVVSILVNYRREQGHIKVSLSFLLPPVNTSYSWICFIQSIRVFIRFAAISRRKQTPEGISLEGKLRA